MPAVETQLVVPPLDDICRRFHIRRVRLFGSAARGEMRPDSDIDVLIDYEPGYQPTVDEYFGLPDELSAVFGGRHIDAMKLDEVHWFIRQSVEESARIIYERWPQRLTH